MRMFLLTGWLSGVDYPNRKSRIVEIMSRKLRTREVEDCEIERVFKKAVNGMRNEMSTVLWRIERSRDGSPEAVRKLLKKGLEAVVGAVEKVMYGVSDGLAKEWRDKKRDEEEMRARSDKGEGGKIQEGRDQAKESGEED